MDRWTYIVPCDDLGSVDPGVGATRPTENYFKLFFDSDDYWFTKQKCAYFARQIRQKTALEGLQ